MWLDSEPGVLQRVPMQCLVCDELECLVCSTASWALKTALLGVQESSVNMYIRPCAFMSHTLQRSSMPRAASGFRGSRHDA